MILICISSFFFDTNVPRQHCVCFVNELPNPAFKKNVCIVFQIAFLKHFLNAEYLKVSLSVRYYCENTKKRTSLSTKNKTDIKTVFWYQCVWTFVLLTHPIDDEHDAENGTKESDHYTADNSCNEKDIFI